MDNVLNPNRQTIKGPQRSLLLRILLPVLLFTPIIPIAALSGGATKANAAPLGVCGESGTPNVIALADPTFYIDSGITPKLDATYSGYTIRAGTSSETNLSIELSGFTGVGGISIVGLADYQNPHVTLPVLAPGEATTSYFLLEASGPTETPQAHTISLLRGGTTICSRTFTYSRVAETIKALANKVDSVVQTKPSSTAQVGDQVIVTVEGRTGTLGAGPSYDPGVLSYAPTAIKTFPANAWRLETTEMNISPNGVLPVAKYTNRLFLSGASGPDRSYVAKYYFKAVDSTSVKATVNPVQYIASGTQVKHTDIGGSVAGDLPIVDPDANITITKSVSPSLFSPVGGAVTGGTASYSLAVRNIGTTTGYLDKIVDTLPSDVTFKSGTATIGGRAVVPTFAPGANTLTFFGPIAVGAGATLTVAYQTNIPNTVGSYTNSVVGYYGNAVIDNSASTLLSTPATATVSVRPAFGTVDAINDTTSTNANTAVTIAVLSNDTPTSGVAVTVTRQPDNGSAIVNTNGTITYTPNSGTGGVDTFDYGISNGDTSDTAVVTVNVPQARFDTYGIESGSNSASAVKTWDSLGGLLGNDYCSASPCTVTTASVSQGAIALTSGGAGGFTYTTPKAKITGTASISYTLKDANDKIALGTGIIYISDLSPDFAATKYRTAVSIDVSANDNCVGSCNPGSVVAVGDALDGVVTMTGTQAAKNIKFTYTPNNLFVGIDTFQYTEGSLPGQVKVLVGAPDAALVTSYGQPISRTISEAKYPSTSTDALASSNKISCVDCVYSVSSSPAKGFVSMVASTGAYRYTPNPTASGNDTFNVSITEPGGLQATSKVDISIGPLAINDPSATTNSAYQYLMKSGTPLSFNVRDNDSCPDTCTITRLTDPTAGLVEQAGTGGEAFTYSNSTAIGNFSFTYQVASSVSPGLTSSATVRINVAGGVDDAGTTSPGIPLTLNVLGNDPCTECSLGTVTAPNIGTASKNSNNTITYVPPAAFAGIANFTYTLTLNGNSSVMNVVVTVKPDALNDQISSLSGATNVIDVLANDVCSSCQITSTNNVTDGTATVAADGYSISYEAPSSGGPFSFDYTITDTATNRTDTAKVTILIATFPTANDDVGRTQALVGVKINVRNNDTCPTASCIFDISSDASHGAVSLSLDPAFEFQYIPSAGFTGTDTFTYSITTLLGMTRTGTVTMYVTPTASNDYAISGKSQVETITVTSNDVCLTCTVSIVTNPTAGSIGTIIGGDIPFTTPSTAGTYTFTYRLTETDTDPTSTVDAVVTVIVGDASPDYVATNYQTAVRVDARTNDTCAASNCTVSNPDVSGSPTGDSAVVVDAIGVDTSFTYTPPSGFVGLVTIPYTVNWSASVATSTVTILVGPAPLTRQADRNTAITGNVLTNAVCSGCTVSLVSAPGVGEITFNSDGSYTYTPYNDWLGTDTAITYRITDPATGLTSDGTLTVTVASLTASIQITKVGVVDPTYNGNTSRTGPGDRVNYTFSVKNTGPIDLIDVVIVDDKIEDDVTDISCPGTSSNRISSLESGATVVCTGFDTLKLADINLGYIDNIATATGVRKSSVSSMSISKMSVNTKTESQTAAAPSYDVIDNASTRVSLERIATMTLVKAATGVTDNDANGTDAGDVIGYSYAVTNTGNVTLYNATVIDDKIENDAADIDCPSGGTSNVIASIDPGVTVTCVGTYAALQADIDAGRVTNTGTVQATAPSGVTDPDPANSGITVLLAAGTKISITKTHGAIADTNASNPLGGVGDRVTYTYTVTNTGNQGLVNVVVTDDKIAYSGINCASSGTNTQTSLAVNASFTCVATYTFTQADFDLGSVTNIGTATGDPATGGVGPTNSATDTVNTGTQTRSMTVVKSGTLNVGGNSRADAGDTISYSYVVTNTGDTTLSGITVEDNKFLFDSAEIDCPSGGTSNVIATLAPAASVTCVASYTVTQDDMDSGSVSNTAVAIASSGTSANGSTTVTLTAVPSLSVVKSGILSVGSNGRADKDDTIAYSYVVTNTGNTTLSNVTVVDDKISEDATNIDCPSGGTSNVIGTLAPAASVTCVASYTVTQEDMDFGSVSNTAEAASGSIKNTGSTTVALTAVPSLSVVKSGLLNVGSNGRADKDDTIAYSYVVTNTGNTTLSNVTVVDDKISEDATNIDCPSGGTSNVIGTLAPAASVTCVASYTVTQEDMDFGSVSNTAEAASGSIKNTGSTTVTLTAVPSLSVVKSGILSVGSNGRADEDDTIAYSYVVTNTGNTTLSGITVEDNKFLFDSAEIDCPSGGTSNVIATLAPAASVTCVASYTVTQEDMDFGSVSNTAVATASNGTGGTGSTTVSLTRGAAMTLVKTSTGVTDVDGNGTDEGDKVNYSFVVTNTGNVTLTSLTVFDDKISEDATNIDCPSGGTSNAITTLAPSATVTCVGSYVLTSEDIGAQSVTNIGTLSASVPAGVSALTAVTSTATVSLAVGAGVGIEKSSSSISNTNTSNPSGGVGDQVTYTYRVTNTGSVLLTNVTVTDDKIDNDAANIDCPSPSTNNVIESLVSGASSSCTATYTLTQADVDAGKVTNVGSVSASPPTGSTVTATDTVTVSTVTRAGAMTIAKSGSLNPGGNSRADVGDTITYSYVVTNTGNITLSNVTVTDDKIDGSAIRCPSPSTTNVIASLAPGASTTCTGTYTIILANINNGSVTNVGTASASVPAGATSITPVTDSEEVVLAAAPSLSLTKTGSLVAGIDGRADAGDTVPYTYVVTNTGNITLSNVGVTDDKFDSDSLDIDCPSPSTNNVIGTLNPGETATCLAVYTVLQADIDAGQVVNTAMAKSGSTMTTGSETVVLPAAPNMSITKSGTLNAGINNLADLGETISYSYVIANTGNVTLANVTVTDDKILSSAIQCPSGTSSNVVVSMAPGATITCVATYSVTQENLDAGLITNIGTVSSGATSRTSSKTVTLTGSPSLEVIKSGTLDSGSNSRVDAGDTISYSFAVKNTGNVTLSNVALTDDRIANDAVDIDCPSGGANNVIATIEPLQTITCVAAYTITQSNIDMGSVTNTATASNGATIATGSKTITLSPDPKVSITKSGVLNVGSNGRVDAGDVITYSFVVTNTGNVTLTNVTVTDDKILDDATAIQCPSGANTNVKLSLSPGESVTCIGDYVVTQSDMNSGSVTNIGSVSATPATGGTTTADNTVAVAMTSPTTTTTIAPTTTSTLAPTTTVAPTMTTTTSEVTATTALSTTFLKGIATTSVTAVDDSVTAPMGAILDIDVLKNDVGSGLAISSMSTPSSGAVKTDGKTIIVTPELMFKGTIEFTYVATDGSIKSSAKVTIKLVGNTLQVLPTIFLDINGNSKRDALEPGIRGISFDLGLVSRKTLKVKAGDTAKGSANVSASGLEIVHPTGVSAQALLAQFVCQSNSRGECVSVGLPLGMYSVEANVNLKKLGLSVTADSDGANDLKATVDPRGNGQPDAEFGLNGTGSVFGYSFVERGDVVSFNPKVDVPLRNIKVTVTWVGLDGVFDSADDVSVITTTDSKGKYSLQGLPIGDYRVEPVVASFKGVTPPASGDVSVKTRSVEQFDLPIRINGPIPDELVRTGADVWQLLLVSLLATLGGVLLVVVKPKRRETD